MPEAAVFVLRAAVLVLLWGFVAAAIVAVRHDVFGTRPRPTAPEPRPVAAPRNRAASRRKASSPAPPPTARALVVVDGALAGSSIPLSGLPITVGRAPDCTVVLPDDFASNHHARLSPAPDGWRLEDLGSTNGTFYDGQRLTSPVAVVPGTSIQIGRTCLELRV